MPFFNHPVGSPRFKVNTLPSGLTPTIGTALLLPFSNIVTDPNGYWDPVNFRWLPKVAGWYLCGSNYTAQSAASTVFGNVALSIRVTGVSTALIDIQPSLTAQSLFASMQGETIAHFDGVTDYLQAFAVFSAPVSGTWVTPSAGVGGNSLYAIYEGP